MIRPPKYIHEPATASGFDMQMASPVRLTCRTSQERAYSKFGTSRDISKECI